LHEGLCPAHDVHGHVPVGVPLPSIVRTTTLGTLQTIRGTTQAAEATLSNRVAITLAITGLILCFVIRNLTMVGAPRPEKDGAVSVDVSDVSVDVLTSAEAQPTRSEIAVEGIRILVTDTRGSPLVGAACDLVPEGVSVMQPEQVVRIGETVEGGQCTYGCAIATNQALVVSKEGHQVNRVFPVVERGVQHVTLLEECPLQVRCIDENGMPIDGARVVACSQIPPADWVKAVHFGGSKSPLHIGASDAAGIVSLRGLGHGEYCVAAAKAGFECAWTGLTDRVRLPSESRIEVIFHQLYVAGVEFPPGGRLVKSNFRTRGVAGRGSDAGRSMVLESVRSRFPSANVVTAFGFDPGVAREATFVGWHTLTGWVGCKVPFCRMDEFVPTRLGPLIQKDLQPGSISVTFVDPDGKPQDIRIAYLAGGNACGLPVDPIELSRVPSELRGSIVVRTPALPRAQELPPGKYRLECVDSTLRKMLVSAPQEVTVGAGGHVDLEIPLSCGVVHMTPRVQTSPGDVWQFVNILVRIDGEDVQHQVVRADRDFRMTPGPIVPCGRPVEIVVTAPGHVPWSKFVAFDGANSTVEIELRQSR